jgi:flagellar protein FliO/FliZ
MGLSTVISSIFAVVIALALVLGLAWGTIWLLKKLQDRQLGITEGEEDRGQIRFIRAMPLGQRERVTLIEIDGERILLGVTAGGISMLARWPSDVNMQAQAITSETLPPRPGAG